MTKTFKENLKVLFEEILNELPENFEELCKEAVTLDIDLNLLFGDDKTDDLYEDVWSAECIGPDDTGEAYIESMVRYRQKCKKIKANTGLYDFSQVLDKPNKA